jgi:hypothetical protein
MKITRTIQDDPRLDIPALPPDFDLFGFAKPRRNRRPKL